MNLRMPPIQGAMMSAMMPYSTNGFAITAQLRGTIHLAEITDALRRLGRRHPIMVTRVKVDDDGSVYLTDQGVPPIPIKVIPRTSDDDWISILEEEITLPFDYRTGPPFRFVWLRGKQLSKFILIFDHLTADGRSGTYALRDLLMLIADTNLELEPISPAFLGDLVPSTIAEKLKKMVAASPSQALPTSEGWQDSPIGPKQVIPFALSVDETTALVERCKVEGVTVQAALCVAFLVPFAERHSTSTVRHVEIPIDIRDRLASPVGESYGMFISHLEFDLDCSPGRNLWDVARDANVKLADSIQAEKYFYAPTVIITVTGVIPNGMDIASGNDISISNLGKVDIPSRYGALTLESVYGPTVNVSRMEHRALGVTTFNGQMYFTFISCDPDAQKIVVHAKELLKRMIS